MYYEHGDLMEINLKQGAISNIGKWFYDEGISNMFRKYLYTAQDFTFMLGKFMLHGLSVLFVTAVSILKKRDL